MQREQGTQVTFHYVNGEIESYTLPIEADEFYRQFQSASGWLILHQFDCTVMLPMEKIVKLEIRPSLPQLEGAGIFQKAQQVTALKRGAKR